MMRKAVKVLRLPLKNQALLLETLVLLALARAAVLLLPFRWVAKVLGKEAAQTSEQADPAQAWRIRRVGIMIYKAARHVPWTSQCLDQAIAAKIMLARRGIPTTVYFGVKTDPDGQLAAHAWLRSGTYYVTGGASRR